MPNKSKLRRQRKELAASMRREEVSNWKPPRSPKAVGAAPLVGKGIRAQNAANEQRKRAAARKGGTDV